MRNSSLNRQTGFSILEVLVSIFVILFGLLGIAALMELGRFDAAEANRADRAGVCGRGALREVGIREMCDAVWPQGLANPPARDPKWLQVTLAPYLYGNDNAGSPPLPYAIPPTPVAIDPLGIAWNQANNPSANAAQLARFPYSADTAHTIPRITLGMVNAYAPTPAKQQAYFERIFRWQDDLVFAPADAEQSRPRVPGQSNSPEIEGAYSWLAVVTPMAEELESVGGVPAIEIDKHRKFQVSVVVFQKREFDPTDPGDQPPSERLVDVTAPTGIAGGDVTLSAASPLKLNIREREWLMLIGYDKRRVEGTANMVTVPVVKWYRVVRAGPIEGTSRNVTLAGPDWNKAWNQGDVNNDGTPETPLAAALFTNVVGVYTDTIEVSN